jgi:hypothetical protein
LRNGLPEPVQVPEVAPSVEASDEVSIIWRWLETNQVRLSESTGALAYPLHRPERLTVVRRAAA